MILVTQSRCHVACRLLGCATHRLCHQSSLRQLLTVHHGLHGLCDVSQAWISEATIRLVLLGTYDFTAHRCIEVCSVFKK